MHMDKMEVLVVEEDGILLAQLLVDLVITILGLHNKDILEEIMPLHLELVLVAAQAAAGKMELQAAQQVV
jgi:hypothetical protein